MSVKTCTKCRQKKPLKDFRKHPNTADGRHTQCRQCLRAYSRAYYYKKKENRHEKNLAPNRLGAPRRKSAQAVNEVAVMAGHRMTPGEAADRLRLAEKILHDVYNLGGADHGMKKRLEATAAQIDRRAKEFEKMERKTRNALA